MRRVFFSFDWDDVWRVNQVRNSWVTKGNYRTAGFVDSADVEQLKRNTDSAIKTWIDKQLEGTSVTCVLIGPQTNSSRWVKYEIDASAARGNGLLGIYIHQIRHLLSFSQFSLFSKWHTYDWESDNGYLNMANWIEAAAKQAGR